MDERPVFNPGSELQRGEFLPPPTPPPLLSQAALHTLIRQGWIPLTLPTHLNTHTAALFSELKAYFALPTASKRNIYPPKPGTEWGHYAIPSEKQFLTLRCTVHPDSTLESTAEQVWRDAATLLHRILCDVARESDLPCSVWDDMLDGTLSLPSDEADVSGTLLRMFEYEPEAGYAGEHTDLGLLTLCVGTRPGLECLDMEASVKQGMEIWVEPEGPVVLVGQTLRGLSEGGINAGVHRVRATKEGRLSVVFALRHGWRKEVDLGWFGGEGKVKPRELYERLKVGVVNVNATTRVRDNQRAELEKLRAKEAAEQEQIRKATVGMG
ncbi:uncharacterized protein HMPREF1541_01150 [Cyphellophora europaea CBS 101466]|uniref:Fe2OG dioxygenase domain-containing protein n=1 Tax=Cyphellophora europaea (strain CBS 101466) TaxID=1220924 RepID=W2SEB6_CYPE1|nr:uncharacterized protein HMPREF1541_01150 [Cyphellophora europaea CBS 101466]ETN46960.1 hypothetical protein HMPREF1541_01150 [Cyphellophora europaea CBS 101466]